jgi:hypothetical protein
LLSPGANAIHLVVDSCAERAAGKMSIWTQTTAFYLENNHNYALKNTFFCHKVGKMAEISFPAI